MSLRSAAARAVERDTAAQGVPLVVDDPSTLRAVAAVLGPPPEPARPAKAPERAA